MATKIVTKNSSTASAVPTASDLVQGELAVNVADKRLFTEDNGGSIVELGTNPTTLNVNGTATMEGLVVEPSSATGLTYAADGTNSYINFEANSISDSVQLYAGQSSGGYFSIGTKNSGGTLAERMRIDASGNVQIGTGTPAYLVSTSDIAQLSVNRVGTSGAITNASRSAAFINVNGANGGSSIEFSTASANNTQPAERMRIDASGKLTYGGLSYGVAVDPDGFGGFGSGYNFETNGGSPRHLVTGPVAGQYLSAGSSPFVAWYTGTSVGAGTAAAERMRIDSSGNVGIGTSSPSAPLSFGANIPSNGQTLHTYHSGNIRSGLGIVAGVHRMFTNSTSALSFGEVSESDGSTYTERMRIDSSGRLGLGVTPEAWSSIFKVLRVGTGSSIAGESGGTSTWFNTNTYYDGSWKRINTNTAAQIAHTSDGKQEFKVAASGSAGSAISWNTAMTVDNSGNLLVGKTNTTFGSTGVENRADGRITSTRSGNTNLLLNRLSSDGSLIDFYKDGTTVGSISCGNSGAYIYFGSSAESVGLGYGGGFVFPTNGSTAGSDNSKDLGSPSYRWDDIYATNGTIQTSDRNEKQDIAELSDAEQRVAVAAKGLLRKFRWKDSVAENGDEARTHFGIIAQDLQAAFAAEGLDAGDYAMFISSTWTDEETNEEKTRMGVRYSELLAFIIAAI